MEKSGVPLVPEPEGPEESAWRFASAFTTLDFENPEAAL
jgi:hypothetical protein